MLIASTVNTNVPVFMTFPPCCQIPAVAPGSACRRLGQRAAAARAVAKAIRLFDMIFFLPSSCAQSAGAPRGVGANAALYFGQSAHHEAQVDRDRERPRVSSPLRYSAIFCRGSG